MQVQLILCIVVIAASATDQNSNKLQTECLKENHNQTCLTPGCIHAASSVLKNMDTSIEPCSDFYKFACGGFLKKTNIPDDKSIVISYNTIQDQVQEQLKTIFEKPISSNDIKPFTLLKKLYNVCLNTSAIEEDGLQTAKHLMRQLGGWPLLEGTKWEEDKFDWKQTMYNFRQFGLPTYSFLYLYVGLDNKNTSRRIVNVGQAMFELEREYLVEGFENDMVAAYYDYLVDVAVIFGADKKQAMLELRESIEFHIKLANITLPQEQLRNITALYNPMSIEELQIKFPTIPWLHYINAIIAIPGVEVTNNDIVGVTVPQFINHLEELLKNTPKRVQANYVMAYVATAVVTYLSKELRNRQLRYNTISDGKRAMESRWKECVDTVSKGMKLAASALYVREYFNEEAKKNARTLVYDIQNTFENILKQVDWMDESTRKNALEKAKAMRAHIAYPDELLDNKKLEEYYSQLESADNYLQFALNIHKFIKNKSFKRLRDVVNKTDWIKHSDTTDVNAFYSNVENSMALPAGILQGVYFDNERPNYMNYGSMGHVIGHEITHDFDDIGRQYNKNGDLSEWWAGNTKQEFIKRAQCIIDQYSNYTISDIGLNLNGINTQAENIADNGGLKIAYLAYNAWVDRNGQEPRLPGLNYTPKQMFWISSANLWCSKQRKEYLRQNIITDSHSPSYYRVLGSFSNSKYFARDFNCPEGSQMNPKHKC